MSTIAAPKTKIEEQGDITRGDVVDILRKKAGEKLSVKKEFVKTTLNSLSEKIKTKKSPIDGRLVIDKILDDLDSYPDV